jgi:hypothetical protein
MVAIGSTVYSSLGNRAQRDRAARQVYDGKRPVEKDQWKLLIRHEFAL